MSVNPFVGKWTYRSWLNDPNRATDFDKLEFGRADLAIEEDAPATLRGTIGGEGWSLSLRGAFGFGSPMQLRFQGKGIVSGSEWVYDYIGWLVPAWPNSDGSKERSAIVGSIVRTVPHPSSAGGIAPAGVVASFYAVRADVAG
jgi:hypothetical protein